MFTNVLDRTPHLLSTEEKQTRNNIQYFPGGRYYIEYWNEEFWCENADIYDMNEQLIFSVSHVLGILPISSNECIITFPTKTKLLCINEGITKLVDCDLFLQRKFHDIEIHKITSSIKITQNNKVISVGHNILLNNLNLTTSHLSFYCNKQKSLHIFDITRQSVSYVASFSSLSTVGNFEYYPEAHILASFCWKTASYEIFDSRFTKGCVFSLKLPYLYHLLTIGMSTFCFTNRNFPTYIHSLYPEYISPFAHFTDRVQPYYNADLHILVCCSLYHKYRYLV